MTEGLSVERGGLARVIARGWVLAFDVLAEVGLPWVGSAEPVAVDGPVAEAATSSAASATRSPTSFFRPKPGR